MPERFEIADLGLDPAGELIRLARRCPDIEALAYGEGEYLIREAETSEDIFIVVRGALVVEQAALVPGGAPASAGPPRCAVPGAATRCACARPTWRPSWKGSPASPG